MSIAELADRIGSGALTARAAVEESLRRIERAEELNAFISVRPDRALEEADELDRRGPAGPLHGVPMAVKDVLDVAGERTTAGSRILADNVATRDAAAVAALRAAGAVIVGKLNTHEFAYGAMTTSPHFGPARNPWDASRICGGSSGGSGSAAAARLVPATLGTDTAGSIRIPACFCGVTGIRPTTGRVSNRGVVPVSFTLDTVGPLAPSAEDCAVVLEAIAGHDGHDPTTADVPVPSYRDDLGRGVAGLRIGLVRKLVDRADPRIGAAAEAAANELAGLGAHVDEVEVPLLDEAATILQLTLLPEAAEVHLPWLRTRLGDYGADVRVRLLTGLLLPATAAVTGRRARRWFCDQLGDVFARFDVLAAPEMLVLPPKIGEDTVELGGERILYRLSLMPTNSPWTLAGIPIASVPCGFADGLPVGLALAGRRFEEATVLRAAHAFQTVTDWHARRPPVAFDDASSGGVYTRSHSEKGA
ncbi:MAG TPA: amidase [Gaiellaceae bacterium]|nr:amidase [Gaiellaceae bacterium]